MQYVVPGNKFKINLN